MKANFVVSMHRKMWLPEAKRLFLTDRYLHHILEKQGELGSYDEIQVAQPFRETRQEFIRDHEYVDARLRKYTPILATRLDRIHGTSHGEWFWRKCISLSLLRHITLCFYTFQTCEKYLRPEQHDSRILSENSYYTPRDFIEHYPFFQVSDYAQEQLFSVYARLFHPGVFEEAEDRYQRPVTRIAPPGRTPGLTLRQIWQYLLSQSARFAPARIWRKILRMMKLAPPLLLPLPPTVGIFGSYFRHDYFGKLFKQSQGKIRQLQLKQDFPTSVSLDFTKRAVLAETGPECDRFDQYLFETLRYAMPKAFVEDWNEIFGSYQEQFNSFKELRYAVCEDWIGNMYSSIALAVLHRQGVKHIYNEHNFLSRPFLGNSSKYLLPLVDVFATLGWFEPGIPNLLKAGSLFNWAEEAGAAKDIDILFVSSLPRIRPAEISACYGDSGARNVALYFDFNKTFFASLQEDTLKSMVYRAYPAEAAARLGGTYDEAHVMREVLARVKRVDDTDTPGRVLIQKSRLVIVNYLATTFLQALQADTPTVFFWNRSTRYTADGYESIFDDLIDAGICQTEPEAAAAFIEGIKAAPEKWWLTGTARQARQKFIDKHLGPPEALLNYLLACAETT